jgi:pimeloyl-ACP methyl ester carboxylesterase
MSAIPQLLSFLLLASLAGGATVAEPPASVSVARSAGAALAEAPPPTLARSECAVAIPAGVTADCFTLSVPENRQKASSHTIRLPIVILRSANPAKKSDPVLFTVGGPGGNTLTNMKGRATIPLLRDRDVILFEQRGNKAATPALSCPEMNYTQRLLSEQNLGGAVATQRQVEAAKSCRARLVAEGIDLDGYNTSESAADIADLRRLLGVPLNLYSWSYGTQVLLEVMRAHPDGIRSVFIDSVLPPNLPYDEFGKRNVLRALDAVFTDCEADLACSHTHPSVRANFHALLDTLNAHPRATTLKTADGKADLPYLVNGRNVVEAMVVLLDDAGTIGAIPGVIDAAATGDYTPLESALQENIGDGGYTWGTRFSVWCHDMAPFNDPAEVRREAERFPELGGYPAAAVAPEVCAVWKVAPAPPAYAQPVTSSIPALVYGGEYDPNTPPQWARTATQTLEHGTFVELAGRAHVAGETRCGWTLLMRFVDDPAKPLDLSCATRSMYASFK